MQSLVANNNKVVTCINCITGKTEKVIIRKNAVESIQEERIDEGDFPFIGPGLIDLQVNGINGIDFNSPTVTEQDIVKATYYLMSIGVTTFLPTVITNSDDDICRLVNTIYKACLADPIVDSCIWGIHLEGPFLSTEPGAKGAHDEKFIKAPNWALFQRFQEAAGGKIKLVTMAPEWNGSEKFIRKCRAQDVLVSIGHSMANAEQIDLAVRAGATMITHLGNAVPLMLPRHPNILWDLLSREELFACVIADGIHVPDSFLKVVLKNKAENVLVVSDATCFAGMAPGEYENHIGGTVILDGQKRVSLKNTPGLLAGAAKTLLENVETLLERKLATLARAWQMASTNAARLISKHDENFCSDSDRVIFRLKGNEIKVETVIKAGKVVFEQ